ncbi:MAG: HEPN domain-containing protein [Clostridia bacterium]|nr:HEPN domain-containing protein [Clostridia bacterium]
MVETYSTDLSKYRIQKATEMLTTAKTVFDAGDYATANNRAYYSIFHAMRAVLALDEEDYKKHSAVIARFSENYLKTDIIPRKYGSLITNASRIRNRSDYQDFYICSIEDTEKLLEGAKEFLKDVKEYLKTRY